MVMVGAVDTGRKPQTDTRKELNHLVREYSGKHGLRFSDTWIFLYDRIRCRRSENFVNKARAADMKVIDYIESRGLLEYTLQVAKDEFGGSL